MRIKHLVPLLVLVGCASGLLAPDVERQAEFVEKTQVKNSTAYTRSLRWFDKNLKYTPGAARVQEPDKNHIKVEAGYSCNVFRKESDLRPYFVAFELDMEAEPGLISLRFTQLRMEDAEGRLVSKPESQLSTAASIQKIQPCLKKMVDALAKAVESTTLTW